MRIHMETERLILRDFEPSDVDNLVMLDADPEVRRYLAMPEPPTREKVESVILPGILEESAREPGFGRWVILEQDTNAFIGWVHFRRSLGYPEEIELGYRLIRSAWGKGYATEASKALIEKGFREQGVTCVTATALETNAASIRVMVKCGMTLQERYLYRGIPAVKYRLEHK